MKKNDLSALQKYRWYLFSGILMTVFLIVFLYIWRLHTDYEAAFDTQNRQVWLLITTERSLSHSALSFFSGHININNNLDQVKKSYKSYMRNLTAMDPSASQSTVFQDPELKQYYDDVLNHSEKLNNILNNEGMMTPENTKAVEDLFIILEQYFSAFTNMALQSNQLELKEREFTHNRQSLYIALAVMLLCILGMLVILRQQNKKFDFLRRQFFEAQKMEALGQLAGGIAHDFNNTLAAILGYSDFLVEDLEKHPSQKKYAENISAAAIDAKLLVEQILAYSRKTQASFSPVNISELILRITNLTQATLRAGIEMNVALPEDSNKFLVAANSTQLNQVLMNICVNAVDAIEQEHGKISIALNQADKKSKDFKKLTQTGKTDYKVKSIGTNANKLFLGNIKPEEDYIMIEIKDTGSGIDKQNLVQIFKPFFSTKTQVKGTGLGLAAVQGIIADHKGALIVETKIGEGTSFRIYLPLANSEALLSDKTAHPAEISDSKKAILLVEDDMTVATMTCQLIERLGHEVLHCIDAQEAIDAFKSNEISPDILITDYKMPKMNGLELSEIIHKTHPDLPIILFTGYSEATKDELESRECISLILKKPATQNDFKEAIHKALNN